VRRGGTINSLVGPLIAERFLSERDPILGQVITNQSARWPSHPTEDPIWGLIRVVMAQQVSTFVACLLAERARAIHPQLVKPSPNTAPTAVSLRTIGLSQRRAQCCSEIALRSDELRSKIAQQASWEQALAGIKGIGPWTLAIFRIMVLRDADVLPLGDVGLERAIVNVYGRPRSLERLGKIWQPFRSVACWYLWKTLGNAQLG
jgi:DNA-3-methyladenine glycosylase II